MWNQRKEQEATVLLRRVWKKEKNPKTGSSCMCEASLTSVASPSGDDDDLLQKRWECKRTENK